jgi:Sec-independent protein translocase protein TatA
MFEKLSPNVKAALVTLAATLFLAVVGGAYKIGYDGGAKDLEAVHDFKESDLPTLIANLGLLSKDFRERADLIKENEKITTKAQQIEDENNKLSIENNNQKKKILENEIIVSDLKQNLKLNFPKKEVTIKLSSGQSQTILPKVLRIGYSASYSSSATVLINGKESGSIPVSGFETIDIAGVTCRLELVNSDSSSIEMVVYCADK